MDEITILRRAVGTLRGFAMVLREFYRWDGHYWWDAPDLGDFSGRIFRLADRLDSFLDPDGRREVDRIVDRMVHEAFRQAPSVRTILRAQMETYHAIAEARQIHYSPEVDEVLAAAARTLAYWSPADRSDHPPMGEAASSAAPPEPESFGPARTGSPPARTSPLRKRRASASRASRPPSPAAAPAPPSASPAPASPAGYPTMPAAAREVDDERTLARKSRESRESGAKPKIADTEYVVWYGTNRRPIDPADASRGYSSARDEQVHYGSCRVFIPESHKIGSIGSGWWRRFVSRKDDRLKLLSVDELATAQFWEQLSARLRKSRKRTGIVFIHGYNVSFEEAALRAAQLGHDLNFKGAMAFFSWPSKGKLGGYGSDGQTIDASKDAIANFLVDFAERSGARRIHVIAHSMGNRGVLGAVNKIGKIVQGRAGVRFGQFILAAADVDADVFRNDCDPYRQLGERTTLYVSAKDLAVEAASWLYDYPRVGFLPPVMVLPGIDTVAVTNIDLTLLGHGYVAEARDVLRDIHSLIDRDRPPDSRFGLRKALTPAREPYWEIGA